MDIFKNSTQNSYGDSLENSLKNGTDVAKITKSMIIHGDVLSNEPVIMEGSIIGNMQIHENVEISGDVKGDIDTEEIETSGAKITGKVKSANKANIGAGTVIIGDISAKAIDLFGAVKGNADVQGPVVLESSAIMLGNIKSESIQVNYGAAIEGVCSQCYAQVNPKDFFKKEEKRGNK